MSKSQTKEERYIFDKFLEILKGEKSEFSFSINDFNHSDVVIPDSSGAPDFIKKDKTIGIELLSLTDNATQHLERTRWDVLNSSRDIFLSSKKNSICVKVVVIWNAALTDNEKHDYARKISTSNLHIDLANLIEELTPHIESEISYSNEDYYRAKIAKKFGSNWTNEEGVAELPVLSSWSKVSNYIQEVTLYKTERDSSWIYIPTRWIPDLDNDLFSEKIMKKTKKTDKYKEYCDEIWLLAYFGNHRSEALSGAMFYSFAVDGNFSSSSFDRIWVMENSKKIYEVTSV